MKTSELIGPALDWAVAKCEGYTLVFFDEFFRLNGLASGGSEARVDSMLEFQPLKGKWARRNSVGSCTEIYGYSTDWNLAGPIIERECIATYASGACSVSPKNPDYWVAEILDTSEILTQYGPTPLIAAMRAFVASRLGDEVEIPEELQP